MKRNISAARRKAAIEDGGDRHFHYVFVISSIICNLRDILANLTVATASKMQNYNVDWYTLHCLAPDDLSYSFIEAKFPYCVSEFTITSCRSQLILFLTF